MLTPYKYEKRLFIIACVVSALFWLALLVLTYGLVLIYALIALLFYLFVHSAFISHVRGTGVRITEEQYPDLHGRLLACCRRTGVDTVPEAYLLRTDYFNALATRFLGRDFIVLFSDVVDALDECPGAVNFYIGHELGHIHRKHLQWGWFIMPASILPLLGTGLRRAQEYTCDRYGAACCDTDADVGVALSAIAAGNSRWKALNLDAYLGQIAATSGFWMSFNELTSDYPWLTKRMASALAFRRGEEFIAPGRHWLARVLALFTPRIALGGGVGLLVMIAVIGILAAVAIPAYQDYLVRAQIGAALGEADVLRAELEAYYLQEGAWPEPALSNLGYASDEPLTGASGEYSIDIYQEGLVGIDVSVLLNGPDQYVVLEPTIANDQITWVCYGQNVDPRVLPPGCQ